MLQKRVIEKVFFYLKGFYFYLFVVFKADGGSRFVINFRLLNRFIRIKSFYMIIFGDVKVMIRFNDWVVIIDFKDVFFYIFIYRRYRRFFRFIYNGIFYQYRVLFFGFKSFFLVFIRVIKFIVFLCRVWGMRIFFYLDDILLVFKLRLRLVVQRDKFLGFLRSLGFLVNEGKFYFILF